MTTLGTNTWGVILSSGNTGAVPSDNIIYLLCDSVKREITTKDTTNHYAGQTSSTIPLGQMYYKITLSNAVYKDKTFSSINSHLALLQAYMYGQTKIYLWLKDNAGTYLDFIIGTTTTDYCPVVVKRIGDTLSHSKYGVELQLEESS